MMMVEYCKMAHPSEEELVASEFLKRAIAKKHYEISRVLLGMIDQIDSPFFDDKGMCCFSLYYTRNWILVDVRDKRKILGHTDNNYHLIFFFLEMGTIKKKTNQIL